MMYGQTQHRMLSMHGPEFTCNSVHWLLQTRDTCNLVAIQIFTKFPSTKWEYFSNTNTPPDTAKLTGPQTLCDEIFKMSRTGELLCITMFDISKIMPKSVLGPVQAQKFLQCLCRCVHFGPNTATQANDARHIQCYSTVHFLYQRFASRQSGVVKCQIYYEYTYYSHSFYYNWQLDSPISSPLGHCAPCLDACNYYKFTTMYFFILFFFSTSPNHYQASKFIKYSS